MPIRIRCDQCNVKLEVASRKAGMTIRCPKCKSEIQIPEAEESQVAAMAAVGAASSLPLAPDLGDWDAEEEDDEDEGFSLRAAETEFDEMDLTPMVDVTFLLLIFFMITASFTIQKTLQIPPPENKEDGQSLTQKEEEDIKEDSVLIDIDEDGIILVDGSQVSDPSALKDAIQTAQTAGSEVKNSVLITQHYYSTHKVFVRVVDAAKEAQVQTIRHAIDPTSKPDK